MRRLHTIIISALIVCLLSGCAGGLLLAFTALGAGALAWEINDFLGLDNEDFTLLMDGYDTGVHPNPNGSLNISGLPAGDHVLSLVTGDRRTGFHANVSITSGGSVSLQGQTPIQAGIITGRVQRDVNGATVPLAGVRVAAVFGGASIITRASDAVDLPPTSTEPTVIMGFTDAQGNYRLGPAKFGDWVVTTAYPGAFADAAIVSVSGGNDAGGTNFVLVDDPDASTPATIRGNVVRENAGALSTALVVAQFTQAFEPRINPARLETLQTQAGADLAEQPWFSWRSLATVTSTAGAYNLEVPPGVMGAYAYKTGYRAEVTTLSLSAGEAETTNFALSPR
ncbi:MAG: hypothetical protein ABFE07_14025 [Armatimonadia bacterium]